MKKIIVFLLIVSLVAVPVSAADYDGMTILNHAFYIDGTEHVIARDSSGNIYYYIDGMQQSKLALFFCNGSYYYMSTSSTAIRYGVTYHISEIGSNGLLPAGSYVIDSDGRIVDPPYYPDDWESQWSDTWPFPSDSSDIVASTPVEISNASISLISTAITQSADWFLSLLLQSGLTGFFLVMFLVYKIVVILLRPILGDAGSDRSKRSLSKED